MPRGEKFAINLRELSGALGDLGTLLPLMLGAIAVTGLAPLPVLAGFAVFYIATAFYYRLPIPVQPMKATAAVLLTARSEAHTSELQSLMRISYAVYCLKKQKKTKYKTSYNTD